MKSSIDHFIICGLGSLGRHCIECVKRYETDDLVVEITAIERQRMTSKEQREIHPELEGAVLKADCSEDAALVDAGIETARAILLVTDDESANIQAAIVARRLNPNVRLVVRSTKPNLTALLADRLGNFVSLNPTDLPAQTFALAAWQSDVIGTIAIDDNEIRIRSQTVTESSDVSIRELVTTPRNGSRIVSFTSNRLATSDDNYVFSRSFFNWSTGQLARPDDVVTSVEVLESATLKRQAVSAKDSQSRSRSRRPASARLSDGLRNTRGFLAWISAKRSRLFTAVGVVLAFVLWLIAVAMFHSQIEGITWSKAMTSAILLLIGGYGDLFGGFDDSVVVPLWVHFVSLTITALSFIYVLSALGALAENLLNARLSILNRPKLPTQNHVVLIGIQRLGKRVAAMLQSYGQEVIAVIDDENQTVGDLAFPTLKGNPVQLLERLHLRTAKSLLVMTEQELTNMEIALAARASVGDRTEALGLIVRAYDHSFARNLVDVLPEANIMVAHELSAEAFAAAAFGENVLGVFRLHDHTVLVPEYEIHPGDHLDGRLLAEVAYGYGTVPLALTRNEGESSKRQFLPPDDTLLRSGDKLVLLATTNGLRRIERGKIAPRSQYRIQANSPVINDNLFSAGSDLARISGCSLESARRFMDSLPAEIELPLYRQQAQQLEEVLSWQLPITIEKANRPSVDSALVSD